MRAEFDLLKNPGPPATAGMERISSPLGRVFHCGGISLSFNEHAGLESFVFANASGEWASKDHPLGEFKYETYTNEDFNVFMQDFAARLGDRGVWPQHSPLVTTGKSPHYNKTSPDDMGDGNFRKPNVTSAHPLRRSLRLNMTQLWHKGSHDSCAFVAGGVLPDEAHSHAG